MCNVRLKIIIATNNQLRLHNKQDQAVFEDPLTGKMNLNCIQLVKVCIGLG